MFICIFLIRLVRTLTLKFTIGIPECVVPSEVDVKNLFTSSREVLPMTSCQRPEASGSKLHTLFKLIYSTDTLPDALKDGFVIPTLNFGVCKEVTDIRITFISSALILDMYIGTCSSYSSSTSIMVSLLTG